MGTVARSGGGGVRKVIAYMALHYGASFMDAAIRSVVDEVDEFWFLYALKPSHGGGTHEICPDKRDDLKAIAYKAAGQKTRWVDGLWSYEGQQRNSIDEYAPNADVIIVVDSDEVFADGLAHEAINYGLATGCKRMRLPFKHLWRTFKRGFEHDPAYPERVIFPKQNGETVTLPTDKRIWHFGYCQPSEIVRYKTSGIHGHQNEFRRDVDWFKDVFMANRQVDCHPVGSEWWDCEDIDLSQLPSVLEKHPMRYMDIIP